MDKLAYQFQISQSIGERLERLATSLIVAATVSIIASVILILIREAVR